MNNRHFGIFGKVFLYTLVFLLLAVSITGLVFAQQFKDLYNYLQIQQYKTVFEPLKMNIVSNEGINEIIKSADEFHDKNQSFAFTIETQDGNVVYTTLTSKISSKMPSNNISEDAGQQINSDTVIVGIVESSDSVIVKDKDVVTSSVADHGTFKISDKGEDHIDIELEDGLLIRTVKETSNANLYKEFLNKAMIIILLLLFASIVGAILFARGITNPVRKLADDTRKMACLEEVSLPVERRDEVGQLARDVHHMYEKLKYTISELQAEIKREKEMEENQRYFFSAASHELKTPIAATSALLEGMIAGIGDYNNHPKYLRECLNMMGAQNRIITEILEIVKLSDDRIVPHKEKVNLLSVIHTILPEYNTLADKKEQNITINVPEVAYCYTDRKMLCNVLSNVVMNAIQNSSNQEEIHIWSEMRDNDSIRLCILNTNTHIDEETKTKLFQPFYRVDKARNRNEGRGGLGLTIVKKILDLMEVDFALEQRNSDVIFWLDMPNYECSY